MTDVKDKSPGGSVRSVGGEGRSVVSPSHRLLIIDLFLKSDLPLREYSQIVGVPYTTLSMWRSRFEKDGPEGLLDKPREYKESGSRLPEVTKRAIVMIREANPEYGCERISDMLGRGPGLGASPGAVLRVIREALSYKSGKISLSPALFDRSSTPRPQRKT